MKKIATKKIDDGTTLNRFQVESQDGIFNKLWIDVYTTVWNHEKNYYIFFDKGEKDTDYKKGETYLEWKSGVSHSLISWYRKNHKDYKKSDEEIAALYAAGDYQYYQETGDKSIFRM